MDRKAEHIPTLKSTLNEAAVILNRLKDIQGIARLLREHVCGPVGEEKSMDPDALPDGMVDAMVALQMDQERILNLIEAELRFSFVKLGIYLDRPGADTDAVAVERRLP